MNELSVLVLTAMWIGFFHTIIGVDHYVPFVALSKSNNWTKKKTFIIVSLCGVGHVLGSVILGFAGIWLSASVGKLIGIESLRGDIATYLLMSFGLAYCVWGIRHIIKNSPHKHTLQNGETIHHKHDHIEHINKKESNAVWMIFIFFVLGPCEPLIPILMYPAANSSIYALFLVTLCFSLVTITTMNVATFLSLKGMSHLKIQSLEKYSHCLAGLSIFLCGAAIKFLGI